MEVNWTYWVLQADLNKCHKVLKVDCIYWQLPMGGCITYVLQWKVLVQGPGRPTATRKCRAVRFLWEPPAKKSNLTLVSAQAIILLLQQTVIDSVEVASGHYRFVHFLYRWKRCPPVHARPLNLCRISFKMSSLPHHVSQNHLWIGDWENRGHL